MRTNPRHSRLLALLLAGAVLASQTEARVIHVIVNPTNPIALLSKKQIIDLFMGRVASFPDKRLAVPLDRLPGEPLRSRFYLALTGKTEAQVDAYWATLVFAGRMSPPVQLESQQQTIATVQQDEHAIAYIEAEQLPPGVKSVMTLVETP